jgi:hypothetical protein
MPDSMRLVDPFVSLQDPAATHPSKGHLASGLLVSPDSVVIPSKAREVAFSRPFEVLIFRPHPGPQDPVERLAPTTVMSWVPTSAEESTLTVVALESPSSYRSSLCDESGRRLGALYAEGRDFWDALEELRLIPDGYRDGPAPEAWEAALSRPVEPKVALRRKRCRNSRNICCWIRRFPGCQKKK